MSLQFKCVNLILTLLTCSLQVIAILDYFPILHNINRINNLDYKSPYYWHSEYENKKNNDFTTKTGLYQLSTFIN